MELKVGELVLYHGRLAEVLTVSSFKGPAVVEVTDEAGLTQDYVIGLYPNLKPLQLKDECVLDAIRRAAAGELSDHEQLKRLAELWLADPQVGDVFLVEDGYLLELTEFCSCGTILATQHPYNRTDPMSQRKKTSFAHDRQLRQWLRLPNIPVYRAAAFATKRPELQSHELLKPWSKVARYYMPRTKSAKEAADPDICS